MGKSFRYSFFTIGIGYCVIWGILFLIMAINGWQGDPSLCITEGQCFCEEIIMSALIREKSQTWSNLALVLSGLIILFLGDKSTQKPINAPHNPMTHSTLYSVMYGFLTINIGIGSFWFHGSLLRYAEFMDTFAMNAYIIFLLYYLLIRLMKKSEKVFLLLYIPTVIIDGVIEWIIKSGGVSVWIFSILAGIGMVVESISLILMYKSKKYLKTFTRDWRWFAAGIGSFGVSFLIWNLSLPGSILCNPYTWLQGHSFWHIGVAASTFFLYLYVRSERSK